MNQNDIEVFDDFDLDDNNQNANIQSPDVPRQAESTTPVYENTQYQSVNTEPAPVQIQETTPARPTIPNLNEVRSVFADPIHITKKPLYKPNENPVAEMVSNKSTMKLIIIILVILFIAVFGMPYVIQWLKK